MGTAKGNGMFRVQDRRMPAFCWQEKSALRLIRKTFKPSERATALAVYATLTELASNNQADEFKVKRQTVGEMVGRSSVRSVDHYLDCFEKLGLIEKRPLVIDNEYKCLVIRLLPTPQVGQPDTPPTQPVAIPVQPTAPPVAIHRDTPGNPLHIESEESLLQKNLHTEFAPSAQSTSAEGEEAETVEGVPSTVRANGAPTAKPLHSIKVPGLNPGGTHVGDVPERKAPKDPLKQGDITKTPETWTGYDALLYLDRKYRETWPGEGAPHVRSIDVKLVGYRFEWLKKEGMARDMVKQVIDHILSQWDKGLRLRLKWDSTRPSVALITTTRIFEKLVGEVLHGPAKINRVDEFKKDKWDKWMEERKK